MKKKFTFYFSSINWELTNSNVKHTERFTFYFSSINWRAF